MTEAKNNGQGKTLWQMLQERLQPGSAAISFYNPLDLRIGAPLALSKSHPEFVDYDFAVKEIHEYTRRIGSQEFHFADYVMAGTNTRTFEATDALILRLRLVPNQAGAHDAILLRLYDEIAFDDNFLAVLKDATGIFEVTDDATGQTETYTRINEVKDSYEAAVLVVASTTDDGKAPPDKTAPVKVEYWDYWRDLPVGKGEVTKKQFLFVEMNSDTGWFQIWRGDEYFL